MRQGEGEEIGRALIDRGPNHSACKGSDDQPGVGQMQRRENCGHQENAQPASSHNQLRSTVDETLEDVLLQQPPTKTQSQLSDNRGAGMPSQEIHSAAKPAAQSETHNRHQYHRQQEQQSGPKEIVETEAKVAQRFVSQPMRKNQKSKRQRDRN